MSTSRIRSKIEQARGLALIAALSLATLIAAGCSKAESTRPAVQPATVEVTVAPVERRSVNRTISMTGTLFGREEAMLAAKVGGRVVEVVRDMSDEVESGEVVLRIDQTDYELALAERQAALRGSLARLGLSELPGPDFDVLTLPTVARFRAEESNARAKGERARMLFEQTPPLMSEQEFADIRTLAEVAARSAEVGILDAHALMADSRTQAAMRDAAAQRLADTIVRAPTPTSGAAIRYKIAERLVSLGEMVTAGQPVARVVAADVIKFKGQVPERFMGQIAEGQQASISLDAFSAAFHGSVARVSPSINERTRSFEVEIEVDNADGALKPGAFAKASVIVGIEQDVPHVPKQAVVTFAGVSRVFSVKDGKAVEHRISSADVQAEWVEIPDLDADEVVTSGNYALSNGQPVNPATKSR